MPRAKNPMGGAANTTTARHPSVPVLGSKVIKNGGRPLLVVEFDVTGLTKDQTGWLASSRAKSWYRPRARRGIPTLG